MALTDRAVVHLATDCSLSTPGQQRLCYSQPSVVERSSDKAGGRDAGLRCMNGEECAGRFGEASTAESRRGVGLTTEQSRSYRSIEQTGGINAEVEETGMTQVGGIRSERELQACVNGCSDPLLSPTRHKYSSETPENDAVSYSDAESDSGFESGTHTFISTATNCSHNEFVAVGKSEESESDEDERIEKAILHLDVKVDKSELTVEALEMLRLLPPGYLPLPHQVAGHRHVDGQIGFLHKPNNDDILYKPVHAGNKGPREVRFYEGLFSSPEEELPRDLKRLRKLIPGYYGVCDIKNRAGEIYQFIKLEDVASRFHKPCILDVKVRKRHSDDSTDVNKIENERRKYPLQEILGFRISGMRVYQSATNDYVYFNKEFGRSFSISEALESLRVFFLDGSHKRSDAIAAISDRLYEFLDWIQTQASYKLFATSLLIIYEGDSNQPIKSPDQLIDVRWVDFAYACQLKCEEQSPLALDENVLFGLKNLIQFLERLK